MRTMVHRTGQQSLVKKLLRISRGNMVAVIVITVCACFLLVALLAGWQIGPREQISVAVVQGGGGVGSGFVVSSDYLVTSSRVVTGSDNTELLFGDGRTWSGKVVLNEPETDIALVSITGMANIPTPMILGNSDGVAEKALVAALGYVDGKYAVTEGTVSEVTTGYIKTDVTFTPGNLGGPLILKDTGEVIGMVFFPANMGEEQVEELRYSISSNALLSICSERGFELVR